MNSRFFFGLEVPPKQAIPYLVQDADRLTLVQVAPVLQVTLFSAALPGEPGGREVLYAT